VNLDDLVLDLPGEEKPKPRPLPPREPRQTRPVAILAAVIAALALGLAFGSNAGHRAAREATAIQEAAENRAAIFKGQRDSLETSLTALSERMDGLESELASATAAAEQWRERAEDASATAAAFEADNEALKRDLARLQKQPGPTSSTAPSSGWKTARVSWYGPGFYGNKTAHGEVLTPGMMNVAHRSLAFGTRIEFRYKGRTCVAVVNDRGPFVAGRVFDLGPGTAAALGFSGVGTVEWRVL